MGFNQGGVVTPKYTIQAIETIPVVFMLMEHGHEIGRINVVGRPKDNEVTANEIVQLLGKALV